jgi:hypothetical protein
MSHRRLPSLPLTSPSAPFPTTATKTQPTKTQPTKTQPTKTRTTRKPNQWTSSRQSRMRPMTPPNRSVTI